MITLNYTYRIYPDALQVKSLNEWLETCRGVYNYALRELKDWIASRKCAIDRCSLDSEYIISVDDPFPGYQQQQNNLPKAKKDYPRLKAVPAQVLQTTVRRLHDAWDFFQKRGYGFPRFKKYGQMKSVLFPQFKVNPITGWQIKLPKLGNVQINLHRPIPDGFVVKQVRVIKKAVGWFAVISIQSDISIPDAVPHGHFIGVDVGLNSYLATSDGFIEPGRKFFKDMHRRLLVLQRRLSKKQKRSLNYEKARLKVAAIAQKAQNQPTVITGFHRNGTWNIPGGNSYVAKLLKDAGANYFGADNAESGSIPLSFEAVYDRALNAQVWLNGSQDWTRLQDVASTDERYTKLSAFQSGRVFNNNARVNEFGGNDYWQSGTISPHLVLSDLVKILHPELLPKHQLIYYQPLK
ncbi:MAG: RNA-guided endonuclease TnpB family protein [Coleofasciculus sp. C1-SOL-03]|uniref:RNA-guided endonuclease TnpB family protein n=1 Tax=Coleofasciculus sp. C1-SOL-03 TaxID=3069522 RepID=UPI003304F1C9